MKVDGEWGKPSVMLLSQGHGVEISFDDLQAQYERYTYTITHCNADWTPSDLLTSDYMTGFAEQRIDDYEPALGTEVKYCHYWLNLPNRDTQLLVSGNYRVDIFEDGEDEPVAQACFSVLEPRVGVDIDVTANTDIDTFDSHQQVNFTVNHRGYAMSNPVTELKYIVMQNRRWDNHVENLRPTLMQVDRLIFNHNRALIFDAGNEYRRFEMLDDHVPTMRIESMQYHDPLYHAIVMQDEQRINYIYDQDQDGRYYVRNGDELDYNTESDYFITHFQLLIPELSGGNLYLFGDFSNGRFTDDYLMQYNHVDHAYELTVPLKQGSYNYMYLFVPEGSTVGSYAETEGNFYQTENEYSVLVYHRPFGARYDHLVGFQKVKYLGNN